MGKNVIVNFPLLNESIVVEEGTKLSEACAIAGYPLNLVCGGKGKCKKCAVEIEEHGEIKKVLSCMTDVYDGIRVLLKEEEQKAQILTSSTLDNTPLDPSLRSVYIEKEKLKTDLCENDWETLHRVIGNGVKYPKLSVLQKLSIHYHDPSGIRVIMNNNEIIDVLSGGDKRKIYGIAFDLGTTSAVGYLYEMQDISMVGISSTLNKQTEMGGDVISRIDYVINDFTNLAKLQKLARDTINEIIEDICSKHKISTDDIYMAVLGGNSTMQHLFLGLYPEYLGKAPFTSTTHMGVETIAKELHIKINPIGIVSFLPLLGGFVGADTTAVLISLPKDNKVRLMLDLGTNGEIAVGKNTSYKVSSTACGPALEGAGLTHGMRGTHGAIERVSVENGILSYQVIGNEKPQGICGSGVIDLVSELFSNNIINKRGALADPGTINEPDLAKRIVMKEDQKAFIIAFAHETLNQEDIYFSQKDIRQVQLAKGAIYTGCIMVLQDYGIDGEDLTEITIAGAFGNYIDVDNAQSIGMLPHFEGVPVRSLGNAAGTGTQMYLLSKEKQTECDEIAKNAIHVELANNPNFMKQYMTNTYFNNLVEKASKC
ncbi:MAG: ATP-binding protein [Eubacteriaceae bacterium]|nr:ATP-binding protein [Eubacteriaceae bacterium]